MMEVIEVAKKIEHSIRLIGICRRVFKSRAKRKAETISNYDKTIAITLIKLRENVEMALEGYKIKNLPISIMEKIAKGLCYQERLEMEKAIANYANAISAMRSIEAELNGWQSIYRHLDER